jgi:hypothetical protein
MFGGGGQETKQSINMMQCVMRQINVRTWSRLELETNSRYFSVLPYKEFLTMRVGDFPTHGDLLEGYVSSLFFALVLAFVSAAYGGLHASAWNDFFPTWQECLIWRISAVVVAVTGITVSMICAIANVKPVKRVLDWLFDSTSNITNTVIIIVAVSFLIFYCGCRIFLVVEAFISIRELPIAAYKTPAWSQLLPHL